LEEFRLKMSPTKALAKLASFRLKRGFSLFNISPN